MTPTEQTLWANYQKNRSETNRNLLAQHYSYVPKRIAERLHWHTSHDHDDLVSLGNIGLLSAIERYNPDIGVSFWQFAKNGIRGTIIDLASTETGKPRDVYRVSRLIRETTETIKTQTGKNPTDKQLSDQLGITTKRVRNIRWGAVNVATVDTDTITETHQCSNDTTNNIMMHQLSERICETLKNCLDEREQMIIWLSYVEGYNFPQIMAHVGCSRTYVSMIHTSALQKLYTKLVTGIRPDDIAVNTHGSIPQ